jgi:hypothetical protein
MKCSKCNSPAEFESLCIPCYEQELLDAEYDDADLPDEDEDENKEPDYWLCYSCHKVHSRRPIGGMCDRCAADVSEEYY